MIVLRRTGEPDILEAKAASVGEVALPEKREALTFCWALMGTLDVLGKVHTCFFSSQGSFGSGYKVRKTGTDFNNRLQKIFKISLIASN